MGQRSEIMEYFVVFWPFALALGLCIGSFLNVCVYRIPLKMSIARGSSICPHCRHALGPLDLVPLFSYFFLRGRCRYCGGPISPRYPIVELLTGLLFVAGFAAYGLSVMTLLCWALTGALIVASLIDLAVMEVPNGLSLFVLIVGLLAFLSPDIAWWERLLGLAAAAAPLFLVVLLSGGSAMGLGDVKLMAGVGLVLGWKLSLLALLLGIIIGGVTGAVLVLLKRKGRKDEIPFVPMLSAGVLVALLAGQPIIHWYMGMLGL